MAPLKSLERAFPIIHSNFQHFCPSHGIFSVEDFLLHDLYVMAAFAEQESTSERLKQGNTQVLSIKYGQHQPWMNGGLREGQITEVVGPSSSGKTQLRINFMVCLQAATNVSKKYVGSVVYLDTGNCFSPTRIAQFSDQISDPALKEEELSIFLLWALSGYVYYSIIIKITGPVVHREVKCHILEEVMGSILCCSVFDIFAMLDALQQLESNLRSKMQRGENRVRLIIIDSISSLITPILGGRGSHGCALMISAGILLKKLAHEHHLAVLVTNDMVGGEGGNPKPALGESWKSIPHVRLLLSCDRGSNGCNMTIIRHPSMASGKAVRFIIYE